MDAALSQRLAHARASQVTKQGVAIARSTGVLIGMALSILTIAALAYWDEQRESSAALADFAQEQEAVASAASVALATLLEATRQDAVAAARQLMRVDAPHDAPLARALEVAIAPRQQPRPEVVADGRTLAFSVPIDNARRVDYSVSTELLLEPLRSIERTGSTILLIRRPNQRGLLTTRGESISLDPAETALDQSLRWVRLSRPEAARLALPSRTAMAGVSMLDAHDLGRWGIVVVGTAQRERDRELHAVARLLLSVAFASGLVLVFGGVALRKQRKQLELASELAISQAQQERDDHLLRADKLATMGALATGIAHEVSTPLGVIMGRAEQLAPKLAGDEKAKRALDVIIEQSERISRVIRGFLGLARGAAPSLERVDPGGLARKAMELVEHRFSKATVRLSADIGASLPLVACDPRLFEQVLVNLLLNACDACEKGGNVEIRVRGDGERVAFVVLDDGVGISDEDATRAMEPFFTTKPEGKGTGLGLAIASEIVKHHQGTLTLRPRSELVGSSPGHSVPPGSIVRGTRACAEIPAARDAAHA